MNLFKKHFFLIIALISFSCSDNRNNEIVENLQGDWTPNNRDEGYFLSFRGEMVSNSEIEFTRYYIKYDTIIIPKGWNSYNSKMPFQRVSDKYIWFTGNKGRDFYPYINTNTNYNDRIILKDIEIHFRNDYYFGLYNWAIYLNDSLDCFLKAFHIKKRGKGSPTVPGEKGTYYSKLTTKEFEFIQRKVRNISLSNLKDTYGTFENNRMHYDPPVIYLLIHYRLKNSNEIKEAKLMFIDYENSPTTVAILINYLHQLHYFYSFKPATKTHNFKRITSASTPTAKYVWDFEDF